jgi:hypothetical protein
MINIQLDTLKIKRKVEEDNPSLAILCPRCSKRHLEKEFLVNVIKNCGTCMEDHPTERFISLPRIQSIYKGGVEPKDISYPPKILWRQQNPNMFPDTSMQYPQQQWVPPMPYS